MPVIPCHDTPPVALSETPRTEALLSGAARGPLHAVLPATPSPRNLEPADTTLRAGWRAFPRWRFGLVGPGLRSGRPRTGTESCPTQADRSGVLSHSPRR